MVLPSEGGGLGGGVVVLALAEGPPRDLGVEHFPLLPPAARVGANAAACGSSTSHTMLAVERGSGTTPSASAASAGTGATSTATGAAGRGPGTAPAARTASTASGAAGRGTATAPATRTDSTATGAADGGPGTTLAASGASTGTSGAFYTSNIINTFSIFEIVGPLDLLT